MYVEPKFQLASFTWVLGMLLLLAIYFFLHCQCLTNSSNIWPWVYVVGVVLVDVVPAAVADLLIGMPEPVLPRHI